MQRVKMAAIKDNFNTTRLTLCLEWHLTDMNKITCIMIMASVKYKTQFNCFSQKKNLISLQCTAKYFDN